MSKRSLLVPLACAVLLLGCDGAPTTEPVCGLGTVEQGGLCVPGTPEAIDCRDGTTAVDGQCVPDAGADPDPLVCGPGTVELDGTCVALGLDAVELTSFDASTPLDGPILRTLYPVDVVLGLTASAPSPVDIQVLVTLADADGGAPCVLGLTSVEHPGDGEVDLEATARFFVPESCLLDTDTGGPMAPGREVVLHATLDPYDQLVQAPGDEELLATPLSDDATFELWPSDGLDVELLDLALDSSVVQYRPCYPAPPGSRHRCWTPEGSDARPRYELQVNATIEAYGVAAYSGPFEPIDALGGHGLDVSYAIRPKGGGGGFLPLYIQREAGEPAHVASGRLDSMLSRTLFHQVHPLHFENECLPGALCEPDSRVADLIDFGSWKGQSVFELRACISSDAEPLDRAANNCRTETLVLLRDGYILEADDEPCEYEDDPPCGGDGKVADDADCDCMPDNVAHVSGERAKNGIGCPAVPSDAVSLCFDLGSPWSWGIPGGGKEDGNPDFFVLKAEAGSFLRIDLGGATSKHDAYLGIDGWLKLSLIDVYAYAGAYPYAKLMENDPDAPDDGCTCNIKVVEPFADPADACLNVCSEAAAEADAEAAEEAEEAGEDPPDSKYSPPSNAECDQLGYSLGTSSAEDCEEAANWDPEEAEPGELPPPTCPNWDGCKAAVCTDCKAACSSAGSNTGACNCDLSYSNLDEEAEDYDQQLACKGSCACIDTCDSNEISCTKGATKCKQIAEKCRKKCQKKKVMGCMNSNLDDQSECPCQAYYKFGVELFGGSLPFVPEEYLLWEVSAATAFSFGYDITKAKEWSKERTWLIGPIPVNMGAGIGGELGITFQVEMHAEVGTQDPPPNPDACALPGGEDRCGQPSDSGNCFCDAACEWYGDCCEDYVRSCEEGFPVMPVVDPDKICESDDCKKAIAEANYVGVVTGTITPHFALTAEAWAGIDAVVARALIKGEVTIVDAQLPIVVKGGFGVVGATTFIRDIIIFGDTGATLTVNFLAGTVSFLLEHIDLEWCSAAFIKYPCGFTYSEWWSYQLTEWAGFPFNVPIFSKFLGSKKWNIN